MDDHVMLYAADECVTSLRAVNRRLTISSVWTEFCALADAVPESYCAEAWLLQGHYSTRAVFEHSFRKIAHRRVEAAKRGLYIFRPSPAIREHLAMKAELARETELEYLYEFGGLVVWEAYA